MVVFDGDVVVYGTISWTVGGLRLPCLVTGDMTFYSGWSRFLISYHVLQPQPTFLVMGLLTLDGYIRVESNGLALVGTVLFSSRKISGEFTFEEMDGDRVDNNSTTVFIRSAKPFFDHQLHKSRFIKVQPHVSSGQRTHPT